MEQLRAWRGRIGAELDAAVAFWERHSHDPEHGGFFSCLSRDGSVYDDTKFVWLQGRQIWVYSRLYRTVPRFRRPELLQAAREGLGAGLGSGRLGLGPGGSHGVGAPPFRGDPPPAGAGPAHDGAQGGAAALGGPPEGPPGRARPRGRGHGGVGGAAAAAAPAEGGLGGAGERQPRGGGAAGEPGAPHEPGPRPGGGLAAAGVCGAPGGRRAGGAGGGGAGGGTPELGLGPPARGALLLPGCLRALPHTAGVVHEALVAPRRGPGCPFGRPALPAPAQPDQQVPAAGPVHLRQVP